MDDPTSRNVFAECDQIDRHLIIEKTIPSNLSFNDYCMQDWRINNFKICLGYVDLSYDRYLRNDGGSLDIGAKMDMLDLLAHV